MKTIFRFACALILAVAVAMPVSAQECGSAVDKICESFASITSQMSKSKDVAEVDVLKFDIVLEQSGVNELPEECKSYELTVEDKDKLNKAFEKFMDVSATKTFELCGGSITKTQIARELEPLRKDWAAGMAEAGTLGDFIEMMTSI